MRRLFKYLSGKDLALDLGTANFLVFSPVDGLVLSEPSLVAVDCYSDQIIAYGTEARGYLGRNPDRVRVERPIPDGTIADFGAAKQMIAHFLRVAVKGLELFRFRAFAAVPLGISAVEQRAVLEACEIGGAHDTLLVEEPIAAAMGAGLDIRGQAPSLVLDVGAGRSVVAILSRGRIDSAEILKACGDLMDDCIKKFLLERFQLLVGQGMAEQVKTTLGSARELPEPLSMQVPGKNRHSGAPVPVEVTDADVREALAEPVEGLVAAVSRALDKAPAELAPGIRGQGLVLCGGGSRLKGLAECIAERCGLPVHVAEDPLTCVARGVARIAAEAPDLARDFLG